jgi:ketosteroid isomerase-like protein
MSKSLNHMILERAIELVEAGWAQGVWAHDARGMPCDWQSDDAVAFCVVGAILRAHQELLGVSQDRVWPIGRMPSLAGYEAEEMMTKNDHGTQESTLAMLRDKLAAL